ncbi:hypothetical protein ABC733_13850 [Mangrovibacter sp. SLW1]
MGSDTVNQVREMLFDQTFIGVCGLDSQVGLSAVYYEDACFKKEILSQSNEVIAAVTQDKMSKVARYKVAQCDDIDIIIVSQDTNVSGFENLNMHIERAS